MDIGGLLTNKIAGIPGWVIALGGGVAIWYFFLRGQSSGSSSSSSGVSTDSAYGLGYAQGLQAAQANGTSATSATSGAASSTPPQQKKRGGDYTPPAYPPGYNPAPQGGGVGGFSSQGSRSSEWIGNYFHPSVTRRVVYSHYVRAVGGAATHRAEVASVAKRAGINAARLHVLNPHHTGKIRVA